MKNVSGSKFRNWVSEIYEERYFFLYGILVVLIVVHILFFTGKMFNDSIDYDHYPDVTDAQVLEFRGRLWQLMDDLQEKNKSVDPNYINEMIFRSDLMTGSCEKKAPINGVIYSKADVDYLRGSPCYVYNRTIKNHTKFQLSYQLGNIVSGEKAGEMYKDFLVDNPMYQDYQTPRYKVVKSIHWSYFVFGYMLINLIGVSIRSIQDGYSVILSLFSLKFYRALIVPYGGILMYPTGDPARQAAEAIRVATMMIISFLMCSASGLVSARSTRSKYCNNVATLIEKIPFGNSVKYGDFAFHGWTAGKFTLDEKVLTPAFTNARLSMSWKHDNGLSFFGLVDLATLQHSQPDWLKIGMFTYTFNNQKISVGRFAAAGALTTRAPQNMLTVNYPRVPAFTWTTGVQYSINLDSGFSFMADVTGTADTLWNDVHQFDKVETSFRLQKKFTKYNAFVAGSIHIGSRANNYVIDGEMTFNDNLFFAGAMYYQDAPTVDMFGGYALGVYNYTDWMALHLQVDVQKKQYQDLSTILTSGIRLVKKWSKKHELSLILDKEFHTDRGMDGPVMLKLQYKF